MKEFDFEGLDNDIHRRVYGGCETCPPYSREVLDARRLIEAINASGRYHVYLKQVVGANAAGGPDWQCEVHTADGLDVLATEINQLESLAICQAVAGADVWLTAY